jgi:hypothetical protein
MDTQKHGLKRAASDVAVHEDDVLDPHLSKRLLDGLAVAQMEGNATVQTRITQHQRRVGLNDIGHLLDETLYFIGRGHYKVVFSRLFLTMDRTLHAHMSRMKSFVLVTHESGKCAGDCHCGDIPPMFSTNRGSPIGGLRDLTVILHPKLNVHRKEFIASLPSTLIALDLGHGHGKYVRVGLPFKSIAALSSVPNLTSLHVGLAKPTNGSKIFFSFAHMRNLVKLDVFVTGAMKNVDGDASKSHVLDQVVWPPSLTSLQARYDRLSFVALSNLPKSLSRLECHQISAEPPKDTMENKLRMFVNHQWYSHLPGLQTLVLRKFDASNLVTSSFPSTLTKLRLCFEKGSCNDESMAKIFAALPSGLTSLSMEDRKFPMLLMSASRTVADITSLPNRWRMPPLSVSSFGTLHVPLHFLLAVDGILPLAFCFLTDLRLSVTEEDNTVQLHKALQNSNVENLVLYSTGGLFSETPLIQLPCTARMKRLSVVESYGCYHSEHGVYTKMPSWKDGHYHRRPMLTSSCHSATFRMLKPSVTRVPSVAHRFVGFYGFNCVNLVTSTQSLSGCVVCPVDCTNQRRTTHPTSTLPFASISVILSSSSLAQNSERDYVAVKHSYHASDNWLLCSTPFVISEKSGVSFPAYSVTAYK